MDSRADFEFLGRLGRTGWMVGVASLVGACNAGDRLEDPVAQNTQAAIIAGECKCVPKGLCGIGPLLCGRKPTGSECSKIICLTGEVCVALTDGSACQPRDPDVKPPAGLICEGGLCVAKQCKEVENQCFVIERTGEISCQSIGTKYPCAYPAGPCDPCIDGNPCTDDACDTSNGGVSSALCVFTNDNSNTCTDNLPCTRDECVGGVCRSTPDDSLTCDDGNVCTNNSCVSGFCQATPADGLECAVSGVSGRCHAGSCCTGCIGSGSCQPGSDVTACGAGGSECQACSQNLCTGLESCISGSCKASAPLDCDDGNPCTRDECDPATGCLHQVAPDLACSDGNPCTIDDRCTETGACEGTPIRCDDQLPCAVGQCVEGTCQYRYAPPSTSCDDGNDCTTGDHCQDGRCIGEGKSCDDGNPCTIDRCQNEECWYENVEDNTACSDPNDRCTVPGSKRCQAGECTGGIPLDCDDSNPCTRDACDPSLGCVHEPSAGDCNDGDLCTRDDRCDTSGVCRGIPVLCQPLDECHLAGTCQPDTGACTNPIKQDGEPCSSGICQDGRCIAQGVGGAGGTGGTAGSAGAAPMTGGQAAAGGAGTGAVPEAGMGPTAGAAGEGAEPGAGSPASGGKKGEAGKAAAGGGRAGRAAGGEAGRAETSSGGLPGDASAVPADQVFERDPGGCDCRTPRAGARGPARVATWAGLAALLLLPSLRRRNRRT